MPRGKVHDGSTATGPIWPTPCRPCAGRMIRNPGHVCRGQGDKSAKCAHCVAGHHRCEDLLVDQDAKIKPAARAVAAASLKVSRGEKVPEYATLATKYNLLARREAKRRTITNGPSAAGTGNEMLTGLMQRQNEILLDIRAELAAMREKFGVGTPMDLGDDDGGGSIEDDEALGDADDDYGYGGSSQREQSVRQSSIEPLPPPPDRKRRIDDQTSVT